jgi:osmoprotectant transport system substrate-binding protein
MRTRSFAALAAVSVLVFAACGDDDDDAAGDTTIAEAVTPAAVTAPAAAETTEAVAAVATEAAAPVTTEAAAPVTAEAAAPVTTEPAAPVTAEAAAAVTTEAAAPVTAEAAAAVTTEAAAPVTAEAAAAVTAEAAAVTTEPAETTEPAAVATEAATAVTEAAAVATTEAAAPTTEAAAITTEAGAVTTEAPTVTSAPATSEPGASVPTGEPGAITVGSADFPESQLLAQIYGQALEAAGFDVSYELGIGSREVYYGAIEGGEVGLVPEYTGSLLSFLVAPDQPDATNVDEQLAALDEALPEELEVLPPSSAEDKDVIVCTQEVVDEFGLTDLSSLFENSAEITLGGPPEMETRTPFGIEGFSTIYGAEFAEFVPLAPGDIPAALEAGEVDCGNIFSTDPAIDTGGFVALEDDLAIVPNEAVLPLVRSELVTPELTAALEEVNAALDTETLTSLVAQVVNEQLGVDVVAEEFLASLGAATPATTTG